MYKNFTFTCKFEEVAIEIEGAMSQTTSSKDLFSTQKQVRGVTLSELANMAEIITRLRFDACPS